MNIALNIFIIIPIIGFFIGIIIPKNNEKLNSGIAVFTTGTNLFIYLGFLMLWIYKGIPTLNIKEIVIFKSSEYEFYIDFYFDKISAVYLFVGYFLTFLITIYCRAYFHREDGYKRFFNTVLFFYMGYNIIILAGNMETMFIGWEILGISSFLLIAFYRNRLLPVKNAVKVFSVYRLGDLGLILAMWLTHHLFNENITFLKLHNYDIVHEHLQNHTVVGVFISLMILITAAAKSAQLPFSSWLPRAMEGPTPSSAIFYGSLSVHIGVFLLLRMQPFWEHQISVRIIIGILGLLTSIITSGIARVQSSIKSQIAYSSASQIGLIFIEIAAGFDNLALIHFAGNAFLRTYQLLVSPSVVTYLIREQLYTYKPYFEKTQNRILKKIETTFYILCLNEFYLDRIMYSILWAPAKFIGRKLNFIKANRLVFIFFPAYILGLVALYFQNNLTPNVHFYLPVVFAFIALMLLIKSFTEKKYVRMSFLLIIMSQFWIALAIAFNENFSYLQTFLYLSGIMISGIVGIVTLNKLKKTEGALNFFNYSGHAYKHPKLAFIFLLVCLGITGFPITPTFVGEDLIFAHIHEDQWFLALLVSSCFLIDGFSIIRIYAKVFLGPNIKSPRDMALRSS